MSSLQRLYSLSVGTSDEDEDEDELELLELDELLELELLQGSYSILVGVVELDELDELDVELEELGSGQTLLLGSEGSSLQYR